MAASARTFWRGFGEGAGFSFAGRDGPPGRPLSGASPSSAGQLPPSVVGSKCILIILYNICLALSAARV